MAVRLGGSRKEVGGRAEGGGPVAEDEVDFGGGLDAEADPHLDVPAVLADSLLLRLLGGGNDDAAGGSTLGEQRDHQFASALAAGGVSVEDYGVELIEDEIDPGRRAARGEGALAFGLTAPQLCGARVEQGEASVVVVGEGVETVADPGDLGTLPVTVGCPFSLRFGSSWCPFLYLPTAPPVIPSRSPNTGKIDRSSPHILRKPHAAATAS